MTHGKRYLAQIEDFDQASWRNRAKKTQPIEGKDVPERDASDDALKRAQWFLSSRSDPEGMPLRHIYLRASRMRHKLEGAIRSEGQPGGPGSVNWTPIGPSVVASGIIESGRIGALVVGPAGARVYAGAADGGVWYSADGGSSWAPLDDYSTSPSLFGGAAEANSLSVGAIAVRFGASALADEIYIGTGEPNFNYDAYLGIGIRHLAGGTWSLEATNLASSGIYAIVIDPDDPTKVLAATQKGLFRRPTAGSMATWTQVTSAAFANASGQASALIVAGSGASKTWYAGFQGDKVYSSPDGVAWTALTGLSGTGRIALGAGESDPAAVYALRQDGTLNRLNGAAWSVVPGLPASALFPGNQGWYDIVVAVDPSNGNTVYLGGDAYSVYKGTLTGSAGSWTFPFNAANVNQPWADPTWVGQGIHSDVHTIGFALNVGGTAHDPTSVWVGCDGGVYQSAGSGALGTFQPRNQGLAITEFASIAQRADTDAVAFCGAQDNGTPRIQGEQASPETAGGDGGGTAFDPTNAYRVMRQYVHGSLEVSRDGGATWSWAPFPPVTAATTAQQQAAKTESGNAGFVAPIASELTGLAAFGTNRLWLTADWGLTWTTLPTNTNPYVNANPDLQQDVIDGNSIRAIAFASATRVFAATYMTVWRYDLSGGNWTKTALPALPPAFYVITDIAVENAAGGTIYVTMGGGAIPHVYYYDGASWIAAMPTTVVDVPTHASVVDPSNPNTVYAGTDVGVWKGVKAGASWAWNLFSQGLPESAVTDLAIHDPARLLRAATHGRGAWEYDLAAITGLDPDIYLRVDYNDTGRIRGGSRAAWVNSRLDPTHFDQNNPYVLYFWMSADIKVRRSSLTGLPQLGSPVTYLDFAVNIGDYVDSTQHIETADNAGLDRIFVEVHNRSLNAVPAANVRVLLMAADASAGLPALPVGYAQQIVAGNTSSAWLAASGWRFVDSATPYRTPIRDVDVRTPQVVEYQLDFSTLGLPAGHDHVCLAAFVTTPGDALTATTTDLGQLAMSDKHVAFRNTHLVAAGARPGTGGTLHQLPRTLHLDFHNPTTKPMVADLAFDRSHFPGRLAVMLPKLPELAHGGNALVGFRVVKVDDASGDDLLQQVVGWRRRLEELLEELGEALGSERGHEEWRRGRLSALRKLDRRHLYIADADTPQLALRGVHIPAGGVVPAAITVQAPPHAKFDDRFRLDVSQRHGARLIGGSTYILVVARESSGRDGC